jgi:CheY-like chemotaxis protein
MGAPGAFFDLVIMDMQMPVMCGLEATRELRRQGYEMPIVVLTANVMPSDEQACIDAGCDAFLTKPVNRKRLIEVVVSKLS